jgi:hypothetical protein
VAKIRFDSTFTLKYARFDSTFTLKYARFDSTFTLKYSPVCNSTFTLKYARFDSTFTLKYARFVCHVDSTTHNFIFSFHVSSLSDGYHPASWFNTQAKANLIRNKYQYLKNSKTISNFQHIFSYQPNLAHLALNLGLLKTHGDSELNPGPTNDVKVAPHYKNLLKDMLSSLIAPEVKRLLGSG